MTATALWQRYAGIWSLPADAREDELRACVVEDVVYCDPNGVVAGLTSLSGYMGGFQASVPGGRFQILSVLDHHDRMLAHWRLVGPDDRHLQSGVSFALVANDGRLKSISGFFPVPPLGPCS
jgi:SnoaL-like domain